MIKIKKVPTVTPKVFILVGFPIFSAKVYHVYQRNDEN